MRKSSSLSFMQIFLRFLLMFQFFHPISTTGILPFLLLTILNFRIYRRYVDIVEFLWIVRIMQWARNFFFLFQNAKKMKFSIINYRPRRNRYLRNQWKSNQIGCYEILFSLIIFSAESPPMGFLSCTRRMSIWQESLSPL